MSCQGGGGGGSKGDMTAVMSNIIEKRYPMGLIGADTFSGFQNERLHVGLHASMGAHTTDCLLQLDCDIAPQRGAFTTCPPIVH